jgi:hypothetical protein
MAKKKVVKASKKKSSPAKKKDSKPGIAFVGCLLLGLGIGQYFGRPDAGVLIGLGVGFIVMAILTKSK